MNIKKILILLIALIIYVNYENYLKNDTSAQLRKIATLKANIKREKQIYQKHLTKEVLLLHCDRLFFDGRKQNFSQAMGAMQNEINSAAKGVCQLKRIKWAQVPATKTWYDELRMDTHLICKPKALFIFINKLKQNNKLYKVKNLRISRDRRQPLLHVTMQLVAFRIHR